MFACSGGRCWVTLKDSAAEGAAVPGPGSRRLPPQSEPSSRSPACPHREGLGLRGRGPAELAFLKKNKGFSVWGSEGCSGT